MTEKVRSFVKDLPLDIPVTLKVLSVFKKDAEDQCFKLECRILDGAHTDECVNLWFYRKKKDGGNKKLTDELLKVLVGGDPDMVPSWKLNGITFQTTPWQPESSRHPMWTRFKLLSMEEPF